MNCHESPSFKFALNLHCRGCQGMEIKTAEILYMLMKDIKKKSKSSVD